MRVPRPLAGDRGVGTLGGKTQRNALLLCLLFLTPPRQRKLVKSTEPKRADLIFKLDSSDYRRSQQLLAGVSGRYLDQALQPAQKPTASCVPLCIAAQKLDPLGSQPQPVKTPRKVEVGTPSSYFGGK